CARMRCDQDVARQLFQELLACTKRSGHLRVVRETEVVSGDRGLAVCVDETQATLPLAGLPRPGSAARCVTARRLHGHCKPTETYDVAGLDDFDARSHWHWQRDRVLRIMRAGRLTAEHGRGVRTGQYPG